MTVHLDKWSPPPPVCGYIAKLFSLRIFTYSPFILSFYMSSNKRCALKWNHTAFILPTLPTFRISTIIVIINPPKNNCIEYNTQGNIWTFSWCLTGVQLKNIPTNFDWAQNRLKTSHSTFGMYFWHNNKLHADRPSPWQQNFAHARYFLYFYPSCILLLIQGIYMFYSKNSYI